MNNLSIEDILQFADQNNLQVRRGRSGTFAGGRLMDNNEVKFRIVREQGITPLYALEAK